MMWSVLFLQYVAHSNQFLITPGSLEKGTMLIVRARYLVIFRYWLAQVVCKKDCRMIVVIIQCAACCCGKLLFLVSSFIFNLRNLLQIDFSNVVQSVYEDVPVITQ